MSDNSERASRPWLFACLTLALLAICLIAWAGWRVIPLYRYSRTSQRIQQKLHTLAELRPPNISPKLWEESAAWVTIAYANVCFSEEHASYEAMCRFEEQLDQKLREDADLGTIEWIGNRLAETGVHGRRYMSNWRQQWRSLQEWGNEN